MEGKDRWEKERIFPLFGKFSLTTYLISLTSVIEPLRLR